MATMTIGFDVSQKNNNFLEKTLYLSSKVSKINKKVRALNLIKIIMQGNLFLNSAIDDFVSHAQFDVDNSYEQNIKQIKLCKELFRKLKPILILRLNDIRNAIMKAKQSDPFQQNMSILELEENADKWSSKKRKRMGGEENEFDSMAEKEVVPPAKRLEIDLMEKEKCDDDRETVEDEQQIEFENNLYSNEKGKEKETQPQGAVFCIPASEGMRVVPLNLDIAVQAQQIFIKGQLSKILVGKMDDLLMVHNKSNFYCLSWQTAEKDISNIKNYRIQDFDANKDYAVAIVKNKIAVFDASKSGELFLSQRDFLGWVDESYYLMNLSNPTKIKLVEHYVTIGTWDGSLFFLDLKEWELVNSRIRPIFNEYKRKESQLPKDQRKKMSPSDKQAFISNEERDKIIKPFKNQFRESTSQTLISGSALGNMPVYSMAMTKHYFVAGSSSKFTVVVELANGNVWRYKEQTQTVTAVGISTDNTLMYSGSKNGKVNIWNLADKTCVKTLKFDGMVSQIEPESAGAFLLVSTKTTNELWHYDAESKVARKIDTANITAMGVKEESPNICNLFIAIEDEGVKKIPFERKKLNNN